MLQSSKFVVTCKNGILAYVSYAQGLQTRSYTHQHVGGKAELSTGLAVVPSKKDICEAFLGKVPNKFQGDWIEIKKQNRIRCQSMVACFCYNRGPGGDYHFYVLEWNHGPSYVELPNQLEDIRLLLAQRSKADLIVYAMVEMHESDQVMRPFGWRQQISPPRRNMDELHNTRGKPYLLSIEVSSRQIRQKSERRRPQQCRSKRCHMSSLSSTLTEQASPMSTPHPNQFTLLIPVHFTNLVFFFAITTLHTTAHPYFYLSRRYIFRGTNVLYILHPHVDVDFDTNIEPDVDACPITDAETDPIINASDDGLVIADILRFYDTLRTAPHSSTEESDKDEDKVKGGDEDEDEDEHEVEVKTKKTMTMVTIQWKSRYH
ncbi:hypothetical protein Gogos_011480 [Gossypium gossypioides]|uniref:Uncharacterized protein n=1 Tax=Gossypium gossypioides TaxID=34282 RepID=A0A7J9BPE9_GOSGO|nr:hypothetical protein [Gossypium gossypioides]